MCKNGELVTLVTNVIFSYLTEQIPGYYLHGAVLLQEISLPLTLIIINCKSSCVSQGELGGGGQFCFPSGLLS